MPQPEKRFSPDFYDVNPPVIPVRFKRPKGKGKAGTISSKGFELFKLIKAGNGKWACIKESMQATIKILGDGYAEIPATDHNRKLLAILSKPMKVKATYDRGVSKSKNNEDGYNFRNNKGMIVPLTDEAIEKGEIRVIGREHVVPAIVEPLDSVREFDMKKGSDDVERVRPWLRDFITVPEAQMESAPI